MPILDLIEWVDQRPNEIVKRVPEYGSGEFRMGSQCVVRDSQAAVFFRDGKALDLLPPGRHTLSTQNIPILADILSIPFGGKSPFRAEVVFVALTEFLNEKWGTPQPILFRDTDFGMVRLRSFGTYSMRVADPQLFVNTVVGTRGTYRTEEITEYLRTIIVAKLTDIMGDVMKSVLDLAAMYDEMGLATKAAVADQFAAYGLELRGFQIGAVTPPEEVQAKIDERSSMGALGDMNRYTQYQTAQAIRDAANNQGNAGGAFGAGLGFGLGQQAANAAAGGGQPQQGYPQQQQQGGGGYAPQPQQGGGQPPQAMSNAPTTGTKFCPNCGTGLTAMADGGPPKFCPNCGYQLRQ